MMNDICTCCKIPLLRTKEEGSVGFCVLCSDSKSEEKTDSKSEETSEEKTEEKTEETSDSKSEDKRECLPQLIPVSTPSLVPLDSNHDEWRITVQKSLVGLQSELKRLNDVMASKQSSLNDLIDICRAMKSLAEAYTALQLTQQN